MIFAPDDFAGRPYAGGLNQMGHAAAGAALVAFLPLAVAVLIIAAWEIWQFKKRGATASDLKLDVLYWLVGAVGWHLATASGQVTGFPVYAPCILVAIFVLEYARIRHATD